MATHAFLSDSWIEATRALRAQYEDRIAPPPAATAVRANLIVLDVPADVQAEGRLDAHLDTTTGEPEIDLGHLEDPHVSVTAPYDLVRSIFVEGNMAKALEGMQLGTIKINGDMFKLMSLASMNSDPAAYELAKEIQALTA